ncbi:MAG: secretin and TonB N-terminal domain-containing protein, partial [Pseudomonas farsensis]|uniref:STN domain-containing protein n=1 Tax=Pseudomonas farsensis TaxID=2745492 RepID=UPI003C7AF927
MYLRPPAYALLLVAPFALAGETRDYHIAPGNLEQALNQFGRQSGALISFGSAVTQGLSSPGLEGRFDTAQGLDALLRGSGLQARPEADNAYTLQPLPTPAAGAPVELGASTVVGDWLADARQDNVFEHPGARDVVRREAFERSGATTARE